MLAWLDLEMSGLNPKTDRILEIAMIITDSHLNIVAEMQPIAIRQSQTLLDSMDDWNKTHHGESGLIERCLASTVDEKSAETQALNFLKQYLQPQQSPLCGNSVHQDRRFLNAYMPDLEEFFHYRNIDVSTVKELGKRWFPYCVFKKHSKHEALADIRESIAELNFYRQTIFKQIEL